MQHPAGDHVQTGASGNSSSSICSTHCSTETSLQKASGVRCRLGESSFGYLAGGSAEERDFVSEHENCSGKSEVSQRVCRHYREEGWLPEVLRAVWQVPETCNP